MIFLAWVQGATVAVVLGLVVAVAALWSRPAGGPEGRFDDVPGGGIHQDPDDAWEADHRAGFRA